LHLCLMQSRLKIIIIIIISGIVPDCLMRKHCPFGQSCRPACINYITQVLREIDIIYADYKKDLLESRDIIKATHQKN
jgi:hypothetical protein